MKKTILSALNEARAALDTVIADDAKIQAIASAAQLMIDALEAGGTIYSCGNGGSMSDAMHFAEELTGRFRDDRAGLSATAISDPGHISCVANDYGYEHIFSRYLEARAKPGDALLAISTSGNSQNVINAASWAADHGVMVITLTGKPDSKLAGYADVDINTVSTRYADRVQEIHIKVIHILIELIERSFFPDNYPD
jgi:D-sedoheptulose 7-phosphate isomerase